MEAATDILKQIKEWNQQDRVVLYMKGTKLMPVCGFSARVIEILNSYEIPYKAYNVLDDEELRSGIKVYGDWPTIPQLYVKDSLVGGCDIIESLHENGELKKLLDE